MSRPDLKQWIGRGEEARDLIDARPMRLMQCLLDRPPSAEPGCALPPLWHWLYFSPEAPQGDIGPDGHPRRGGFLPPVDLPRRMWAGGRFRFLKPLRIGEQAEKLSVIKTVSEKLGRSGALCFVTVGHQFRVGGDLRLTEEHDIVYRDNPEPGAPPPSPPQAPGDAQWTRRIEPDPVMLFRYSALTFNGHRIHYDRAYCREVEGYPGLIFHGPLTATLLLDLVLENLPGVWISEFSFRAVSPLFDTAPFTIAGRREDDRVQLWAANPDGGLAMTGQAVLAPADGA